jgi:hypothetical protein
VESLSRCPGARPPLSVRPRMFVDWPCSRHAPLPVVAAAATATLGVGCIVWRVSPAVRRSGCPGRSAGAAEPVRHHRDAQHGRHPRHPRRLGRPPAPSAALGTGHRHGSRRTQPNVRRRHHHPDLWTSRKWGRSPSRKRSFGIKPEALASSPKRRPCSAWSERRSLTAALVRRRPGHRRGRPRCGHRYRSGEARARRWQRW